MRTTKNILKQKSLIGFVPDFFGVYENLSVIEYLEFFAASYGIYGRAGTVRAREVLEMVELSGKEEQMVDSLSRGMQQRLCLARAMIHKPKLLVLDEPNSGLDPRSRKDFQLLLQRLAREDYTILISSHISSDLEGLCDDLYLIDDGKIALHEEMDVLLDQYGLLKMDEETWKNLDKSWILRWKKESWGVSALTNERAFYQENYPKIVAEKGSVDEMVYMAVKGETV